MMFIEKKNKGKTKFTYSSPKFTSVDHFKLWSSIIYITDILSMKLNTLRFIYDRTLQSLHLFECLIDMKLC